jgi:RNA polymerase-binding protein DksA
LARRSAILEELGIKKTALGSTAKDASGDLSMYSYHMADLGTDAMEREKSFYFASKTGRFLYHIDEALRRIENNTYGMCHGCGKQINPERLKAVPHARFCINCKEKEEQREAQQR